ncbi:MAG: class I adenylate-forming enzyme family protein [Haliea sp.]|uniref:class I adenylate-forming enzyme family protein n=1 Tax=Haliea sp. TaxID=1932666 RepID=UPI0032EBB903
MKEFEAPVPLLPEILALHGKWRARKPAVICGDTRLDWAQFTASNHRFAHGLLSRGVVVGDRVGVVMSNGLPMVQALFGTLAAGAVSVPVNLSVSDDALLGMLRDAGITALVISADQRERLQRLLPDMPESLRLRVTDGAAGPDWLALEDFCAGQSAELPTLALAPDAPLNIIYSSGTTGQPKGILHSHRTRRDWAYDLAIALRYHGGARTLLTLGLYSNISWVAMLCTVLAGGTLVVHTRFDPAVFLASVEQERITHTAMVPVQFQRVCELMAQGGFDVGSMQAMMSCGSPLREGLKRDIFHHFPCGIIELYGLTEGIITTLETEEAAGRWDSVGKPLIGTDICIVDDDDRVLGANRPGEIVSRGRITMPGYWRRDDANLDSEFVDEQGRQWLRSGDVGYIDDQGYLFIVDRKKDMILSGGQNIYPQDIEAVLVQHPAISDVAVIGIASARWGETPLAVVVPAVGAAETSDELLSWANTRLGKQQRLAALCFADSLPRNPNGKILKRELRQQFTGPAHD